MGGTVMEAEHPKLETKYFKLGRPVWMSNEKIFVVKASSVRFFPVVCYRLKATFIASRYKVGLLLVCDI